MHRDISAKGNPSELRMLRKICSGVQSMSKKVGAVVTGIRIKLHAIGVGMKSRRAKPLLIDVRQRSHHTAVPHPQQIKILWMRAVLRENGNRIQTRAIVMQLAFDTRILTSIKEIPVTSRTAVVSPRRYGGHVGKDRVERDVSLVVVAKVACPGIDLLLSRRVPWHLTAKGIRLALPVVSSFMHPRFQLSRPVVPAFSFKVSE